MPLSDLSSSVQDYLKVIWNEQEWGSEPVTTTRIAEQVGVRPSTASVTVKRLAERGLLTHAPYGAIELTDEGRAYAVGMVRRHRLIETFLVEVLGYGWDEVHDEAEILEHAVSDQMIDRIDAVLGHPTRDPHGDPIPSVDGRPKHLDAMCLTACEPGARVRIVRLSDDDPAMLRHFAETGLVLDAELKVLAPVAFSDDMVTRLGADQEPTMIGKVAAEAIWVAPL